MRAQTRPLIHAIVILMTASLLVFASAATLVQHMIAALPKAPGIWGHSPPVHFLFEATVTPPWETGIEEGDSEPDTAKAVPIWNQDRSGDIVVAFVLALILPWIASQFLRPFPDSLWNHLLMRLS